MTRPTTTRSATSVRIEECKPISKLKRWEVVQGEKTQKGAVSARSRRKR